MKKLTILSILIVLMSLQTNAQDVRFGIKTGLNFSKFHSNQSAINAMASYRSAFHVGGLIEFSLSDSFSLQPELFYSSEGGDLSEKIVDDEFGIVNSTTNISTNYISLPIILKLYVNKNMFFEAGPQMDFLISANGKTQYTNNFQSEVTEIQDLKEGMVSNKYGVSLGLGYKADNGIFVDTRYVFGLSDTTKNVFTTIKNNGFQFSIGFML